MESRHEAAMAALKDGWAAELRRQKEAWAAAEKIKRESWAEEKTREVKELTIKGLEPEIQRLMAKHKVDLRKVQAPPGRYCLLSTLAAPMWGSAHSKQTADAADGAKAGRGGTGAPGRSCAAA